MADSDIYQLQHSFATKWNELNINNMTGNNSNSTSNDTFLSSTSIDDNDNETYSNNNDFGDGLLSKQLNTAHIDIDGGLQRALLLSYDAVSDAKKINSPPPMQENGGAVNDNDDDDFFTANNQPHRPWKRRENRKKYKIKKTKHSKQYHHLNALRKSLPLNPNQLKTEYKSRLNYLSHSAPKDDANDDIDQIQQRIIKLENELSALRMRQEIENWRSYKKNWQNWKLIDFYEYLRRLNDGAYINFLATFDVFKQRWIWIVANDTESRYDNIDKEFNGNLLVFVDHHDLRILGIKLTVHQKSILKKIKQLIVKTNK